MAIVIDENESRDRRIKMLLDTAAQAAQIQNQKQQLLMTRESNIEDSKLAYAKLGMRPIDKNLATSQGGMLPSKMVTGAYGQSYVPSPALQSITGGGDIIQVDNQGNAVKVGSYSKGDKVVRKALTADEISERKAAEVEASQKAFKEPEITYLGNVADSRNTLSDLRKGLEDLGIKDPSKFGVIEEETVDSEFGPLSLPARFNLVGQYAKDPEYTAMKRKLDRFFNQYRKVITGAQASFQELESLQQAVGSFKDRPSVFFANLGEIEKEMDRALNTRLDIYDDVGRDTSRIRKRYQINEGIDTEAVTKALEASGVNLGGKKVKSIKRL